MMRARSLLSAAILTGATLCGAVAAQAAGPLRDVVWSQGGTAITSYNFGSFAYGGPTASQTFTLTDSSAKPTSDLTASLSGSSQYTISSDGCTGQRLSKKVPSCEITVQYTPVATTPVDTGSTASNVTTLMVTGKKVSSTLDLTAQSLSLSAWNRIHNTSSSGGVL